LQPRQGDSPAGGTHTTIGGRATLKMLRRKRKTQFANQEHNTQTAFALFNYLKRIAKSCNIRLSAPIEL
jgi:hypothetical protein